MIKKVNLWSFVTGPDVNCNQLFVSVSMFTNSLREFSHLQRFHSFKVCGREERMMNDDCQGEGKLKLFEQIYFQFSRNLKAGL